MPQFRHTDTTTRTRRRGDGIASRSLDALLQSKRAAEEGEAINAARVQGVSPDDLLLDRVRSRSSLAGAAGRLEAVRLSACVAHDARPGEPCWGDERSQVRGYCSTRWQRAVPSRSRRIHGGTGAAR